MYFELMNAERRDEIACTKKAPKEICFFFSFNIFQKFIMILAIETL